MNEKLWQPSINHCKNSLLSDFAQNIPYQSYIELHQWSIENLELFWSMVWDYGKIIGTKGSRIIDNANNVKEAVFFPDGQLNFAENLLRRRDDSIAITALDETGELHSITYQELYHQVACWVIQFKQWGIQPGERIVGYLPNLPETVVAMLAAASIGAIWSACSPDFGAQGIIDRFSQIQPKVLIACDGYYYHGKTFNCLEKIVEILPKLPTIVHTVIISVLGLKHNFFPWENVQKASVEYDIPFVQLPFNAPLCILYSSGTTGTPKCILHSAGGTLIQHIKEHQLHCDIKKNDKVFYFSTCGWMMWNWLVSALASNAQIILYDGYPDPELLFKTADQQSWNFFGASAKLFSLMGKENINISKQYSLKALKTIASTGSPLLPENFSYVYQFIKKDVLLASISGGSDIISCFVLGNHISPVYSGEIQGAGLGMNVEVFSEEGNVMPPDNIGELVCTKPFPSRPLGFWNDLNNQKYYQTYYNNFPGVWHHGDLISQTTKNGFILHGRSDTLLKPNGVRIGTAEIYRQIEDIPEILEAVAVGQHWQNDERIILFVVLKEGEILDVKLKNKIKEQIRHNATPRHVPAKIIQVIGIPKTKNHKVAELAVKKIIHNQIVSNTESLINPESLSYFKDMKELLTD